MELFTSVEAVVEAAARVAEAGYHNHNLSQYKPEPVNALTATILIPVPMIIAKLACAIIRRKTKQLARLIHGHGHVISVLPENVNILFHMNGAIMHVRVFAS